MLPPAQRAVAVLVVAAVAAPAAAADESEERERALTRRWTVVTVASAEVISVDGHPSRRAAPERLEGDLPAYTAIGGKARIQGTVILDASVDATGQVTSTTMRKGLPMALGDAAAQAVAAWRFPSLRRDGERVPFVVSVTFSFRAGADPMSDDLESADGVDRWQAHVSSLVERVGCGGVAAAFEAAEKFPDDLSRRRAFESLAATGDGWLAWVARHWLTRDAPHRRARRVDAMAQSADPCVRCRGLLASPSWTVVELDDAWRRDLASHLRSLGLAAAAEESWFMSVGERYVRLDSRSGTVRTLLLDRQDLDLVCDLANPFEVRGFSCHFGSTRARGPRARP